jgi:hypothetical protein
MDRLDLPIISLQAYSNRIVIRLRVMQDRLQQTQWPIECSLLISTNLTIYFPYSLWILAIDVKLLNRVLAVQSIPCDLPYPKEDDTVDICLLHRTTIKLAADILSV